MPDKKMYNNIIKWVRAEIQKLSAQAGDLPIASGDVDIDEFVNNVEKLAREFDIILTVTGVKDERNDAE